MVLMQTWEADLETKYPKVSVFKDVLEQPDYFNFSL